MGSDAAYFTRRACEERASALHAAHPNAELAHLQLAQRYEELADAVGHWTEVTGVGEQALMPAMHVSG